MPCSTVHTLQTLGNQLKQKQKAQKLVLKKNLDSFFASGKTVALKKHIKIWSICCDNVSDGCFASFTKKIVPGCYAPIGNKSVCKSVKRL